MGILYFALFFIAYCFLLVTPTLFSILQSTPAGPEQQKIAEETVRTILRPKLPIALFAALLTTGLGIYWGIFPGSRR